MSRIALADDRYSAVKIVQRDVRLGKLVDNADVVFVELVSLFNGAERADRVAGFYCRLRLSKASRKRFPAPVSTRGDTPPRIRDTGAA
jgi:hypothetical protein